MTDASAASRASSAPPDQIAMSAEAASGAAPPDLTAVQRAAVRQTWHKVRAALANPRDLDYDAWADAVKDAVHEYADAYAVDVAARQPIPMLLYCPNRDCGAQHVDAPEPGRGWTNPPHKSHLCHRCGAIWRPADVPTTGVAKITTRGASDVLNRLRTYGTPERPR